MLIHFSIKKSLFITFFFLTLLSIHTKLRAEKTLFISGWPLPGLGTQTPSQILKDDPVSVRLTCPSFSRLNLKEKRSESVVFNKVEQKKNSQGKEEWSYFLRTGLYWWNGQAVSTEDIAKFFEERLARVLKEKGLGRWPKSAYQVKLDKKKIMFTWNKKPVFGPYVFNGEAFSRSIKKVPSSPLTYECIGLYKPSFEGKKIVLEASSGYKSKRPRVELIGSQALTEQKQKGIHFSLANSFSADRRKHRSELRSSCQAKTLLPMKSLILWNSKIAYLKDKKLRKILSAVIPRKTICQWGAAGLADCTDSFVPINHPGFYQEKNTSLSLEEAIKQLDELSYERKNPSKMRFDPISKKKMLLNFGVHGFEDSILVKILEDLYTSLGFEVKFSKFEESRYYNYDAVLFGLYQKDSAVSSVFLLHSQTMKQGLWQLIKLGTFDALLDGYARSLTEEKPDFSLLRKISQKLAEEKLLTVISQPKACVKKNSWPASRRRPSQVNSLNPDWFKELLL